MRVQRTRSPASSALAAARPPVSRRRAVIVGCRVGRLWLAVLLGAVALGCPNPPEIARSGGAHPLPTMDGISFGDESNMSGNSFGRGVSAQFGEAELRRLYLELNGAMVRSKLQSYMCPTRLPEFKITVALYYEGSYQERTVRLQMTPPLYKQDGRIEGGIGYLFEQAVKRLDKGPPIDYGYRRPLDGSKLPPPPRIDLYQEPAAGDCGKSGDLR